MFYYVRAPFGHVTFKCGENYEVIFISIFKNSITFSRKRIFIKSYFHLCVLFYADKLAS
jgi:hypothetical protein